jgi:predicted phage terminase large subunit-like protein
LPLADFVADMSTRADPYERPVHLAPLIDQLEGVDREPVRALCSVPPRHAKTETILHAIARRLLRKPQTRIAYVSYGYEIACDKSRRAQEISQRAGVTVAKTQSSVAHWKTSSGGCVFAAGIGGPLTALGFDWIIIDDPHKNRAEAESSLYRKRVDEWFTSTAMSRVEPGGSVLVNHTRWHPDDLIGRLTGKGRWQPVNLPAVSDDGRALWPTRWPLDLLAERRAEVGEYDWNSLYLGRPRIRGGTVFQDVHFYDGLPPPGMRIAIGVDFAYTAKTSSDWSVAIVVGELKGVLYVLHVVRKQCAPPVFAGDLKVLAARYPGAGMHAYIGGTEQGTIEFLNVNYDVDIIATPAKTDKFQRAQPTAAKWNAGAILIPEGDYPWTSDLVSEVLDFTGVNDANDDQVDALASAADALARETQLLDWEPLQGGNGRRW